MRVRYREQPRTDIDEIRRYLRKQSPSGARNVLRSIYESVKFIAENPGASEATTAAALIRDFIGDSLVWVPGPPLQVLTREIDVLQVSRRSFGQLAPRHGFVAVFAEGRGARWNHLPPGKESAQFVQDSTSQERGLS